MKKIIYLIIFLILLTSLKGVGTNSKENRVYPVAVIGYGAAGTMAVKRIVLNNNPVLLFTGAKQEIRRSRGNWVRTVDNIPGFERYTRTIVELRDETLADIKKRKLGSNLTVIEDSVYEIEKQEGRFKLVDGQGRSFFAQHVILATGIMDEQPHIQGSIRPILKYANGQTAAYCLMCDGHRSFGKKTAVIGHSEEAGKSALILSEKYQTSHLSILTNGQVGAFSEETLKKLQERGITIFEEPILEILGNEEAKQLLGFKLEKGSIIDSEIVFVALGIRPNNQLALQLGAKTDERGLVITDVNGETSVPELFVAGDLRSQSPKQIYTAWQHAVDCAQEINKRLREASFSH